jgi:hypothetical protein
MRFLQNDQYWAGPTDTRAIKFSSNSNFKEKVHYNPNRHLRCKGWYSAEIQDRHWFFLTEPFLYNTDEWVTSMDFRSRM